MEMVVAENEALENPAKASPQPKKQPTPLIELEGIEKWFGDENNQPKMQVLHGISLAIHPGEFVAIVGTSGSGKSTLMNILGCLDRPSAGKYMFSGHDVSDLNRDQLAWLRRKAFGFIFQGYHLIPSENAAENVEVPALYAGLTEEERRERALELLARLGLEDRSDHKPNQLSGGQQQRVSIARALMNGGYLILADEPTGALDSRTGADVMKLLRELSEAGHTILLITHDPDVAQQADRIIEIKDGKIISDQSANLPEQGNDTEPKLPAPDLTQALQDKGASLFASLQDASRAARRVMQANPIRTFLTLLGIIIGVASVIVMLSIAEGTRETIEEKLSEGGVNLILLDEASPAPNAPEGIVTLQDVNRLARLPEIQAIQPERGTNKLLRFGNRDHFAYVRGSSIFFPEISSSEVVSGRFFTESEYERAAAVAVIGQRVRDELFGPNMDVIGQLLVIDRTQFRIVGLLEELAKDEHWDENNEVIVPYHTAESRLFGPGHPDWVTIMVNDAYSPEDAEAAITETMLELHDGVKDFNVANYAAAQKMANEVLGQVSLLLGSIGVISLLVGGIGVMNVMLMTVRERTREIGIRMATGARQKDILRQFLTESVLLSIVGGILGIGLALALLAIAMFSSTDIPVSISATTIAIAFSCSVCTGMLFGFMPARKASGLDPVTALATD